MGEGRAFAEERRIAPWPNETCCLDTHPAGTLGLAYDRDRVRGALLSASAGSDKTTYLIDDLKSDLATKLAVLQQSQFLRDGRWVRPRIRASRAWRSACIPPHMRPRYQVRRLCRCTLASAVATCEEANPAISL